MQKVQNERHQFIGKLAIALKSAEIQITFDSLKSIMKDRGYAALVKQSPASLKASCAALTTLAKPTFSDKDGNFAYDPEK